MEIKILGTGCAKCQALERNTRDAVAELGISANIEKISDIISIMKFDILITPGLVVDGQVVAAGKLLSKEEIKKILAQ